MALLITGNTLSIPAFIGMILLVGIVVDNAIVLIDSINRFKRGDDNRCDSKIGPVKAETNFDDNSHYNFRHAPHGAYRQRGSEIQIPWL